MIEKIQFGGITRRPSDLSSREGACEESLNVTLDVNEIAPVIEPEDKTAALVGNTTAVSTNITDRYIYIHKTGAYQNYIALNESTNELYAYVSGVKSSALLDFDTLSEVYKDITSVGNTLIVSTDKNIHYILFKDGRYVHLGTKIPEPKVDFRAVPAPSGIKTVTKTNAEIGGSSEIGVAFLLNLIGAVGDAADVAEEWNKFASNYEAQVEDSAGRSAMEIIDSVSSYVWDQYNRMRVSNRNLGLFSAPVFVRSAIRLYDESYIYQSVPYLLHTGQDFTFLAKEVRSDTTSTSAALNGLSFALGNVYQAQARITYSDLSDWSDIVRSVDIFVSTDVCYPKVNARINGAIGRTTLYEVDFLFLGQEDLTSFSDELRDEILSKVNFYLTDSQDVEDIGTGVTLTLKPASQDELVVRTTLPDDNLSHHAIRPNDGVTSYNSRLIYRGLVSTLYSGHPYLQSAVYTTSRTGVFLQDVMEYRYFIRTEDGDTYTVIGRNALGTQQFTYPTETVGSNPGTTYYGLPCGFLYYPDPRCYRCEIYYGSASAPAAVYSVPMKEHPGLNGSYAICSLEDPVSSIGTLDAGISAYPTTEKVTFAEENKLVMSEASNPFQMLLTNRQTFTDAILAVATTTKALSTGQFGQFPLYVFTKGGIWAVPITGTGAMADAVPLSRDVALSSESVTPIDQAIVFVTKRGVMMLTGSDIQDLSPEMDGRHYSIEDDAADLLEDTEWEKYLGILADTTPFMTFMKDARAAYDYSGRRLVFFNGQTAVMQTYQYVFKLDTHTWHKMSLLQTGFGFANILNGYPDALICFRNSGGVYCVCDLSVHYNASGEQSTLSQVVITRPYNFNLDFVSKTIRRMYVRGIFEKENIKFILLGSPDGLNYHVIHSLRGPSNNVFFRAIILGTLSPTERVSYLELDYEARFKDRPR